MVSERFKQKFKLWGKTLWDRPLVNNERVLDYPTRLPNKNDYAKTSTKEIINDAALFLEAKKDDKRQKATETLFRKAGYDVELQPLDKKGKYNNVIARKEGRTDKTIVIGAHYDREGLFSKGIIDNGLGVSAVSALAKSLKDVDTLFSYEFVAFGAEGWGNLAGSKTYAVNMSPEQLDNTLYMIDVDIVGAGKNGIVPGTSNSHLNQALKKIAQKEGIDLAGYPKRVEKRKGKKAERGSYVPFDAKNIPTICFRSEDAKKYSGKRRDKLENVEPERVGELNTLLTDLIATTEEQYQTGLEVPEPSRFYSDWGSVKAGKQWTIGNTIKKGVIIGATAFTLLYGWNAISATPPSEYFSNNRTVKQVQVVQEQNEAELNNVRERYAVLMGGVHPSAYQDLSAMHESLVSSGYHPDNITVIFNEGPGSGQDAKHGIIDMPMSEDNVYKTFKELETKVTGDDALFVYASSHGVSAKMFGKEQSYIILDENGEERLSQDELRMLLMDDIKPKYTVLAVQACHSGGFSESFGTEREKTIGISTTSKGAVSMGDGELQPSEFTYHFSSAIKGQTPKGESVNADYNKDGHISVEEAFDYAGIKDRYAGKNFIRDGIYIQLIKETPHLTGNIDPGKIYLRK